MLGLRWRWVCLSGITCCLVVVLSASWLAVPSNAQLASLVNVHSAGANQRIDSVDALAASTVVSETTLLSQGKQHYDAGQFSLAIELWQRAANQAPAEGTESVATRRRMAITYHYLSIGQQALGQWPEAIASIEQAKAYISKDSEPFVYAQVLNTEGNLRLETGQAETALALWRQAEALYRAQADTFALVRNQLNQIHALRVLGHYRQARQALEILTQDLSTEPDSLLKAQALQSLGITLRAVGNLDRSERTLAKALAMAEALPPDVLPDTEAVAILRLSLAKTLAASGDIERSLVLAQQVGNQSDRVETQIEATLLWLSGWQEKTKNHQAEDINYPDNWLTLRSTLQTQLEALPASRWGVYAQVNLAAIASEFAVQTSPSNPDLASAATLLADAIQKAQSLSDQRAESYALGALGKVYEQVGQWTDALQVTQQALDLANQVKSVDIAVTWQWQKGRLLSQADNPAQDLDRAVIAYTSAVAGLESIQQDLVAMSSEVQFSFREQVEPVYRQLVDLLLKDVDARDLADRQQRLEQSQQVIELLQLAELQNYFREACLTYAVRPIETIDPYAAVIYPILLSDRLEVIVSLPASPLQHHSIEISEREQAELFRDFYLSLNPIYEVTESYPPAQRLYDELIRPCEPAFEQQAVETLVFVPDVALRGLPMAALYDGSQYLVEKYRIATTPGMQLLSSEPLQPESLNVLSMGLSEARGGFSAIPAVERELDSISELAKGHSLLNQDFTRSNFFETIETTRATVVHLATHGQFSSSAQDTFLLAWDDRINVSELDNLLRQQGNHHKAIELLVLSACQTASGDERAALGMAGIAVRAGARSTLATLWSVADESTAELMSRFYTLLTQGATQTYTAQAQIDQSHTDQSHTDQSHTDHSQTDRPQRDQFHMGHMGRAEALRQAQLSLLHSSDFSHPYYWAPFVLVGNWQ